MIYIVMGLPGSGKTEATKYLQKKLNAIVVNTDELRTKLFPAAVNTKTGDFTPEQLKQVYKALRPIIFYLVKAAPEKHYILEGSFRYEAQRTNIIAELDALHQPHCLLFIEIKTDVAKKRMEYRHLHEGAPDVFEEHLDQLKVFERPKKAKIIDNSSTRDELYKKLDMYLDSHTESAH
jgi:predicted kinase